MKYEKIAEVYFHIKATQAGIGEDKWDSTEATTINLIATGTATSFKVNLEGKIGETWSPITSVRLDNLSICETIGVKEITHQADLIGFRGFRCNLTDIVDGDITIYGYAVN